MGPNPVGSMKPCVTIEYTSHGKRQTRTFDGEAAHRARVFYGAKARAGKDPKVIGQAGKVLLGDVEPVQPTATEVRRMQRAERKVAKLGSRMTKPKAAEGRDALGCFVGTQSAAINKLLTKKPQTNAELAKRTQLPLKRVANHTTALLRRGLLTKTAQGFALK